MHLTNKIGWRNRERDIKKENRQIHLPSELHHRGVDGFHEGRIQQDESTGGKTK